MWGYGERSHYKTLEYSFCFEYKKAEESKDSSVGKDQGATWIGSPGVCEYQQVSLCLLGVGPMYYLFRVDEPVFLGIPYGHRLIDRIEELLLKR